MPAVNLDELEQAAVMVEDGAGEAKALVSRETGMVHLLNDAYMDEEAPLPADVEAEGNYVVVPAASALGIGDALLFRFAGTHLAGDEATVRDLLREQDEAGFFRLLEERGATDAWSTFHDQETRTALERWCGEHGLQLQT